MVLELWVALERFPLVSCLSQLGVWQKELQMKVGKIDFVVNIL